MANPLQTHSLGNILRVVSVNPAVDGDYVDEVGFFIKAETEGYIRYCPMNNKTDAEAIEKNFVASTIFVDPELCRKIFSTLTPGGQREMAEGIYIGYGV